jgi:hypothetical protein
LPTPCCIDQCFIADDMLEQLPAASQVGKTIVVGLQPTDLIRGGIDLNKTRMRSIVEAVIALSPSPNGFTASDIAARVCERCAPYGPRHAAYDLQKLRGKQIVGRIGHTRRYEPLANGLRAITALIVLRNKAIKPLLAAARPLHPTRSELNPKPIDAHRCPLPRLALCHAGRLPRTRHRRMRIDKFFVGLRPDAPMG